MGGKIKLKKKKLSLILVSALAVITLLAGCGKEKATSTEGQNTGNSKSEKKIIVGTSPDYYHGVIQRQESFKDLKLMFGMK